MTDLELTPDEIMVVCMARQIHDGEVVTQGRAGNTAGNHSLSISQANPCTQPVLHIRDRTGYLPDSRSNELIQD